MDSLGDMSAEFTMLRKPHREKERERVSEINDNDTRTKDQVGVTK